MFKIRLAKVTEAGAIRILLEKAATGPPGQFIVDEISFIENILNSPQNGFIQVIESPENGEIIAAVIVWIPGDSPDNIANDLNLDYSKAAHVEVIAVHEKYRGNGLQRRLLESSESLMRDMEIVYSLATVAPTNNHSLANFHKHGHKSMKSVLRYGGLPRILLAKKLV